MKDYEDLVDYILWDSADFPFSTDFTFFADCAYGPLVILGQTFNIPRETYLPHITELNELAADLHFPNGFADMLIFVPAEIEDLEQLYSYLDSL